METEQVPPKPKLKLLVDADIYLYRVASAVETPIEWAPDFWTLHSDPVEARGRLEAELAELSTRFEVPPSDVLMCFTDSENWRKAENPEYKSNRKGVRKPLAFKPVKDWCMENMQGVQMPGLEADDVLGILSTQHPETIIVSTDKDLQGIPGRLFNPDKDTFVRVITPAEANRWHAIQTMTGDRTDGYPGCPGIGPVKAEKALENLPDDPEAIWAAVLTVFEKAGQTKQDMVMNARMARICRTGDWDFKTRRMTWMPKI